MVHLHGTTSKRHQARALCSRPVANTLPAIPSINHSTLRSEKGGLSCSTCAAAGRRNVESQSHLVGLVGNKSTITTSEPLFSYHGFPLAAHVFSSPNKPTTASSPSSVPCSVKGITIIHKGSMLTLGQSTSSLSVAKLWGLLDDPITQLTYQLNG